MVARLGTETHGTPVVAGGRVYIGTNNGEPRDPKHQGDRGVLMCFEEKTGRFLWQLVVPKRVEDSTSIGPIAASAPPPPSKATAFISSATGAKCSASTPRAWPTATTAPSSTKPPT